MKGTSCSQTPVALATALAIAANTGTTGGSPRALAPYGPSGSGAPANSTSTGGKSTMLVLLCSRKLALRVTPLRLSMKQLLAHGDAEELQHAAGHLVLGHARVDDAAGVVRGDVAQHADAPGLHIDLDLGEVGGERVDDRVLAAGGDLAGADDVLRCLS